jgi:hypothetical protein
MKIETFIQQEVLFPRLKKSGVLIAYDSDQRYKDTVLGLLGEKVVIVDAGESSILSREQAQDALCKIGMINSGVDGLVIYVPSARPVTDEEKQGDPFSLYTVCGSVFPDGDGDSYQSLCLKAKPDHATEIRRIFSQDPNPDFSVIDAVGEGTGWPTLQALLKVESAREILFALLAPKVPQLAALKGQEAWVAEAKQLLQTCLGLTLLTRAKTWSPIADELWRFVLFSEFVFDLPVDLPESLQNVPKATENAQFLVDGLCDDLRNDRRTQIEYLTRAEAIEKGLEVAAHCIAIENLGKRDTFPFEERSFLARAVVALEQDDPDTVREILEGRRHSVWSSNGDSQAQWTLLQASLDLIDACDGCENQLAEHTSTQSKLVEFYIARFREVDRRHREFEQVVTDHVDAQSPMQSAIAQARNHYRALVNSANDVFIRHLVQSGWPPDGYLANADVFDKTVAPVLKESGRRVAYFMVDALRYELGVALEHELAEDGKVQLQAAFASLPTVTPVGMSSLLPNAGHALHILKKEAGFTPSIGDTKTETVSQRMDILKKLYGNRFSQMPLDDFLKTTEDMPEAIDLLVIRSTLIDSYLESTPEDALPLIGKILRRIRTAIHKLAKQGFQEVVIATDHGFHLHTSQEAGDVCNVPQGNWVNVHNRSLLGSGSDDVSNFVVQAEKVGIRGDFDQFGGPKGLVPYRAGVSYFHGGASLQECIVPVLTMRLKRQVQEELAKASVEISYRNNAKAIMMRNPVLEIKVESKDLFAAGDLEVLVEARDKDDNLVGEAKVGGAVNPATGTISLTSQDPVKVTLQMDYDFEGSFTVQAINPATLVGLGSLKLKTDYAV